MAYRIKPAHMKYASFLLPLAASSSDAWAVHSEALKRQRSGEDVIVLSVGDPDFDTPKPIVDTAISALLKGETKYSPAGGIPELRDVIAKVETQRLGIEIDPAMVTVTAGAQNALYVAFRCLVEVGDEVILLSPPYVMFEGVVNAAGASPVTVPLDPARNFAPDLQAVEKAITPRTRAILLNSPHNPSGSIIEKTDLVALCDICRTHDLALISDEVYADLCFSKPFHGPFVEPGMKERTIIIRSLSKSHAMSGWRIGWTIGPVQFGNHARDLLNSVQYGGSTFLQRGAVKALEDTLSEAKVGQNTQIGEMKAAYQNRAQRVANTLKNSPAISVLEPQAGVFCLADISKTKMTSDEYAWALLEETGISVLPGTAFGTELEGKVRLSLCQPMDVLEKATRRIAAFHATHFS